MSKASTSQAEGHHLNYRPDIDGLRAVAVLLVLGFHVYPELVPGGFVGVDIFFVISGYLISSITFEQIEKNQFSALTFYSKRILRIFPALLLVLSFCLIFGWFALYNNEYAELANHVFGGSLFVSNFIYWNESGYFSNSAALKPLLHLWSLAVEEQFYIIWPSLLLLIWRFQKHLTLIVFVLLVCSFGSNIYLSQVNPIADFYAPYARFWEILFGILIACISRRLLNKNFFLGNIYSIFGVLLVATAVLITTKADHFPGWIGLLPVLGAVFLISASPCSVVNQNLLSNRYLVSIGLISYPLYLWHWPLISFAYILEGRTPSYFYRAIVIVLSFILAWGTFLLLEKPIRFGGYRKLKTFFLILIMLIIGCAGLNIYLREGLNFRSISVKAKEIESLNNGNPHLPLKNQNCQDLYPQLTGLDACLISNSSPPEILILGDSHANQLYKSFSKALPNKSVMNLSHFSCLPFSSKTHLGFNNCVENQKNVLKFIASEPSIKLVILSGYWSYLEAGSFKTANDVLNLPSEISESEINVFMNNSNDFLSALLATNKRVILFRDIPDLDFNIKSCYGVRPFGFVMPDCSMTSASFLARNIEHHRYLNDVIQKHVIKGLTTFDPTSIFCDGNKCYGNKDGRPLYYNYNHLTLFGSELVTREFLKQYPEAVQ